MVKVTIIKVYQPNIFLGTDLDLFEKVCTACQQIRDTSSLLLPCSDIAPQMVLLFDFNDQLIRLRVLSAINPNTFRCLLIDHGRIEEVKKHRLFMIPPNQLQIAPAVKLYKITGIVPAGLNIANEGVDIKATLSESKEWIRASYKFVCQIFLENPLVNISYIKECSKDKALVEVFVTHNNQNENLKDLLIREHYAFPVPEGVGNEDMLSQLSLDGGDAKIGDDGLDSLSTESISKLLEDVKDEDNDTTVVVPHISDVPEPIAKEDKSDSLSTNKSTYGTLDEISSQILNNKVKSWLVTKCVESYENDEPVIRYKYKSTTKPILSYQNDQMIAQFLKDTMVYHKTKSLLLIQALMIPSILRGVNVLAIAPSRKGKSMGLVMPVLQKIATKPVSKSRSFNPLAIILCTSWKKVKEVSDSALSFIGFIKESSKIRKPKVVQAYAGQREKKVMIKILEGCDMLIVTPKCLLRLLKTHEFFKLNELEILGLDDAENLIAHNYDAIKEILIYKRTGATESNIEVQILATATNWTSRLQSFVQNEMGKMFMLTVNNPLEIAVFERLKQKLIEHDKDPMSLYEKLLTYLEMTESSIKRTIIFASDDRLIRTIYLFLMQKVTFDLKLMVGSMTAPELKQVEREWNQYRGYVNMPVLLISDEALGRNDISIFNAHTLLHADINPATFGTRLNFLRDSFAELSFLPQSSPPTVDMSLYHSYVFVCADTLPLTHANFLYKFLGRCYSERPSWLEDKAINFVLHKEKSKVINEICPHIKVKGECQFPACNKRHIVVADVDKPQLPNRGQIKFRLLHLVSPSNFFVRIIEHKFTNEARDSDYKSRFTSLKLALIRYFSDPKNVQGVSQKFVQPGFIGAIRVKDMLERVLVLKLNANKTTKINVKLIDHGSTMMLDQADLLTLPKELMEVPAQAVEVFVAGIRPLDNEEHYHEESRSFAHEFLVDKDFYGVIMLCIGKTLWLDSVTQLTHFKATNITVYDNNLSVELVEKDFVERNPGHIQKLIRLCTGKIDIWSSGSLAESKVPMPIMRKFTYKNEPLTFEELALDVNGSEVTNECTVLRVVSPQVLFLGARDSKESIRQMENEVGTLAESIETLAYDSVSAGSRVLYKVEGVWQRGYVMSVDECKAVVYSLDWGTITTYTRDTLTTLRKLPTEYQALPCHAILAGLRHCCPGQPFSDDVNEVIEDFVTCVSTAKRLPLTVSAYDTEDIDGNTLFPEDVSLDLGGLDLVQSMKKYSVCIARRCNRGGDEDEQLLNVLVQRQCVVPSPAWIHIILPECQPFLSRLERSGSIAHIGLDILSTRDKDRRLKLSATIERIIAKHISYFESRQIVPSNVDSILHTLLVLLHFIQDQPVFMCYYRSFRTLLTLAYQNKLPMNEVHSLEATSHPQLFSIPYVSRLLYSYQSIVYHILRHLALSIGEGRLEDCGVFLDILRLLMVDSCFVNSVLSESSWVAVLAGCVQPMAEHQDLFMALVELVVQLVMLCEASKTPVAADIVRQCVVVLAMPGVSEAVWGASVTMVSCVAHCKQYQALLRDLAVFPVVLEALVARCVCAGSWREVCDTALEALTSMWRTMGPTHRAHVLEAHKLSDAVSGLLAMAPGHETLARLHTDLLVEESSSSVTPATGQGQAKTRTDTVTTTTTVMPDIDAAQWMALKNNTLLKKHKKSYRRVYENKTAMDDSSGDDDDHGSQGSDSHSSTDSLEVAGGFLKTDNPADEDNVACYDQP